MLQCNKGVTMDEKTIETLRLASKAVDDTNKLNKHIITCVTIILCVGFVVFGCCNMYNTFKMYDYDYSAVENRNVNVNNNKNWGD